MTTTPPQKDAPARPADDREAGRVAVAELCAAFEDNLEWYKSGEFDETSTRQRFIDKFFAALGWDVTDELKRGPFADVILEFSLRGDRPGTAAEGWDEDEEDQLVEAALAAQKEAGPIRVRRPDYSFRIGAERQFFVEAKRPQVNIDSPRPIFQVKSYAWSAQMPLAILTDFEDLLVFDCRIRPRIEEPRAGLLPDFRLSFRSYPEQWDLLWDTFSRESVAAGSLARYVEHLEDIRGQTVDQTFLADLARWRQALAADLAKLNPSLDVWDLNDATQLVLDRLVFVRVCEDRRLEPQQVLRPLLGAREPYAAFREAIVPLRENYNGGLLDPHQADELAVSPPVFKRIIRGLYPPWSPYRFDVLRVEILGSIYERALGSTITLADDRKVRVELKPEVRKAGGVYYTPAWVVDEIVRMAIDPLIRGKTPKQLSNFRVLDPACGSGSFLLAAFGRLIVHFEEYYTAHPTVDRRKHFRDAQGIERLTAGAKAEILRNSIFGVDVDPAAAEVTTMSLYLKSLESDAPEYVRTQMQLSGAILPSLAENIRVGNSLVSTDWYQQQQQLGSLEEDEEHKLRPFRWDSDGEGFGRVLSIGGFDAVIGNPPYYNVDATYGKNHPVATYLKRAYPAVWQDKTDIYYYFLAKGSSLARQRLGFIVSRAFLEADKAKRLRGHLATNAKLAELVDLDSFRVFPDAGIATAIIVLDPTAPHRDSDVAVRRLDSAALRPAEVMEGLRARKEPFEVFTRRTELTERPWRFPNPFRDELYWKLDAAGAHLGTVCVLGQGMQTGANAVFGKLTDDAVRQFRLPRTLLKKRARNSDIDAFYIGDSGEYVFYLEDVRDYDDLPAPVRKYLEQPKNKAKLEGRAAHQRGDCEWWRYTWPLHKDLYSGQRLVSPYRTGHNRFALEEGFRYATLTDTTVVFRRSATEEDLRYIQGLLNSKTLTFRFRGLGKLTSPNMWEAFDNSISELPIRRIDFSDDRERQLHDDVVGLVDAIVAAKAQRYEAFSPADRSVGARKAAALTDQLEGIVLDLYGITDAKERTSIVALGEPLE